VKKNEKLTVKTGMLRNVGKQPGEAVELVREKKKKATVGKICRKEKSEG